ncbi:MAG: hypothetical protein OEZ10_10730 [Gammaproteobacteria bacterium]|nr:hypothetical protein [Gammaproteobacteria bacterium]
MDEKQRRYAALAPILAIAGIFIDPTVSAVLPLVIFFVLHRFGKTEASTVAIRAADLVFTAVLLIILISLVLTLLAGGFHLSVKTVSIISFYATILIMAYLGISLVIAAIQASRGKVYRHIFSFGLAERLFTVFQQRNRAKNKAV